MWDKARSPANQRVEQHVIGGSRPLAITFASSPISKDQQEGRGPDGGLSHLHWPAFQG